MLGADQPAQCLNAGGMDGRALAALASSEACLGGGDREGETGQEDGRSGPGQGPSLRMYHQFSNPVLGWAA